MARSLERLFAPPSTNLERLFISKLDTISVDVPEELLNPIDITGRADIVPPGLRIQQRGAVLEQHIPTHQELSERSLGATLDIDPNVGLLTGTPLEGIDPTTGLLQFSQEETKKEKEIREFSEPSMLDKFLGVQRGEVTVTKEIPNPLIRDANYRPDIILYGPNAGIVTAAVKTALPFGLLGLPAPEPSEVRPEAQKSPIGEGVASFGGEIIKYAYLGRFLGGLGLTGAYKWGVAGLVSGENRGLIEGKSQEEILTTPDIYIEAALAGSPYVAIPAIKQGAGFLRKYIKRPIQDRPGASMYRDGKIVRRGELSKGDPLLDPRSKPIIPEEVFGDSAPVMKFYRFFQKSMPKVQDDIAKLLDNSAAAAGMLASLNESISRGAKGIKTAKDHFIGASRFLWQAKNRGKELEFKQITTLVQQVMEREHMYSGMFLEDLRVAGIKDWSRGKGTELAFLLERDAIESVPFREILDKAHKFAAEKGVNVIGYRSGYFPRMIKSDIAHNIADDIEQILKGAGDKGLVEELGIYLQPSEINRIKKIAETWVVKHPKRDLSKALKSIVDDKNSGIDNYGDALYFLRKQTYEDLFNPFGNLERPRTLPLPDAFYERDASVALVHYLRGVAKRAATVETFGENGEKASLLLKALHDKNPVEAEIAKQIIDSWSGRINVSKNLTSIGGRRLLNTIRRVSEFDVVTKIGFGFSTIPNMTQILISGFVQAGFWPTVKGGFSMLSKANRSKMRRFGIMLDTSQDAILGYNTEGAWSNFRNLALEVSGFAGMNRINQYWSAGIGKHYLEKLYGLANRPAPALDLGDDLVGLSLKAVIPDLSGARTNWARRRLDDYGIDWRGPLTDEIKGKFMWRFSNESQLMRNVLREPLAANDPRFRWMFLFKRFGLKQAQLIKEQVWNEFWRESNIFPLLRLVPAGYLGGEFVGFAKAKVSELISGESYYREPDRNMWEGIVDNLASVGGFGVMGDLMSTVAQPIFFDPDIEGDDVRDVFRGLKFLGTPVQVQTMADLFKWISTDGADLIADIDDPVEWREAMTDLMGLLGTVSRRLSKRFDTPGRKQNRLKARRSNLLDEVRDMAIIADDSSPEKFQSLWNEIYLQVDTWNTAYPEFFIDVGRDLNPKAIEQKRRREELSDFERLFPAPLTF